MEVDGIAWPSLVWCFRVQWALAEARHWQPDLEPDALEMRLGPWACAYLWVACFAPNRRDFDAAMRGWNAVGL